MSLDYLSVHLTGVSKFRQHQSAFSNLDRFLHWHHDPHRNLLCAIIKRALLDLELDDKRLRLKALNWLLEPSDEPFSFPWCCQMLEISPERALKQLMRKGFLPSVH